MSSCVYCNDHVDPNSPLTWHRIVGWERKGMGSARRSGSDIKLREREETYACHLCVTKLARKLNARQGALW
jgi:hypothetical protein